MLAFLLMIWTAWVAGPAWAGDDDGYRMNDLGGTVHLPPGWRSKAWADWQLDAVNDRDHMELRVWFTPYQVPVDEVAAKAWADAAAKGVEKAGHTDVKVESTDVAEVAGRPTARARIAFVINHKVPGVALYRAFAAKGKVIHVRLLAAKARLRKARSAMERILADMEIDAGPAPTTREVESEAGFAATLPEGWRAPLPSELPEIRKLTARVGEDTIAPKKCWAGIHPQPVGKPDVILACRSQVYVGPLDEYSAKGVEKELHEQFFGRAKKPVPPGEPVTVGDRMGLLFRPPVAGMPTRLVLTPYSGGLVMMWGLGESLDEAGLEEAVTAVLPTVRFTGPDGGKPVIGADKWVAYYLKYRPFSPVVLGPAVVIVLVVVGIGVAVSRRRARNPYDDLA